MNKFSDVLAERFSQDLLESYFCKQHPPRAWKDELPLYDSGYANTFRIQKLLKPIAAGKVRDENINFESDRTISMSEKIQTKQSLLSSKVSYSHQMPSYQTYTTSMLCYVMWNLFTVGSLQFSNDTMNSLINGHAN